MSDIDEPQADLCTARVHTKGGGAAEFKAKGLATPILTMLLAEARHERDRHLPRDAHPLLHCSSEYSRPYYLCFTKSGGSPIDSFSDQW